MLSLRLKMVLGQSEGFGKTKNFRVYQKKICEDIGYLSNPTTAALLEAKYVF
jgi:hypothetical protein